MAFSNGYTMGFAAAICVVCSLGVASTSIGLKPLQDANKLREFQTQILTAVGLGDEAGAAEDVGALYAERIREVYINGEGEEQSDEFGKPKYEGVDRNGDDLVTYADVKLARKEVKASGNSELSLFPVFVRRDEGNTEGAYAIEMQGKGLWGPISGYLALKPDGQTILGATFAAPKETPGLGYEIVNAPFCDQWKGKKVLGADGTSKPVAVVKGKAAQLCPDAPEHCVDGISGATITSQGVTAMVETALDKSYKNYLRTIQSRFGG